MHLSLLFLGFLGLARAWVLPSPVNPNQVVPPTSNPNFLRDQEGRERQISDPLPPSHKSKDPGDALSDAACDVNGIMSANGQDLVKKVSSVSWRCINDNFFLITGDRARQACPEAKVLQIAQAFYYPAEKYDGNKPQATPEIHPLATYLRACYYVQYYNSKDTGNYSTNSLLATLRYGFDKFLQRPNLESKNDEHLENLNEIVSLISGVHDQQNYIIRLSQIFAKLSNTFRFEANTYNQGNAMTPLFDNYFRVHGDAQFNETTKKAMNDFFSKNINVPAALNDFLTRHSDLINTDNEWLIRNAALELGRFLMYPSLNAQIASWIKNQFSKYNQNNGDKVWAQLMNQIMNYDPKNCAQYNACNFKADLEKRILANTKSCGKNYVDTFVLRYQSMTDAEANQVCQRLKEEENYFHNLVKDNWRPVTPDTNDKIEVVIFNTRSDYQMYANMFFGIDTNNGGMYLEGDPSKAGNVARYLCYESPYSTSFDVWNLEHEFVHYLDGRYDMKGDFTESSSGSTIWWVEGFAEYASKKNNGPTQVQDCKEKKWPLSTIFQNVYGVGEERIYHYGYLAVRFMFDRHRSDVDNTILPYFRVGKYQEFKTWLNGIGSRYDKEFSQWCDCIAKGSNSC